MANNNGTQTGNGKQISSKFRLSSDWGLKPDPMKSESVVIADQQVAVNTFSGLVHTARQANKVGGGRRAPQGELSRIQRWGLSRNKVSLAEAGDGSPPFYIKNYHVIKDQWNVPIESYDDFLSTPRSGCF